MEGNVVTVL